MKVIKNIKVLNDDGDLVDVNIALKDGVILEIAQNLEADEVIDGHGCLVTPAFIDVHTHTRNPGQSHKETLETLEKAALAGGYQTLMAMPNTTPIVDNVETLKETISMLNKIKSVDIKQYAALSENLVGEKPGDYRALKKAGAIALSNDGRGVQKEENIKSMMIECVKNDMMYVSHSEIDSLLFGGVMHEGIKNKQLNLRGITSSVEAIAVAKEIILASELGCRYHVCHISSKYSVDLVRLHKSYNSQVSCEVSPHHLVLSENDILSDDPNYKMNPPLRSESDRLVLIQGLNDGTIEIIATDHAPHHQDEKGSSFEKSAFGIIGLETCFNVIYQDLVKTNQVKLKTVIDALTINPANKFKLEDISIKEGNYANLTFINLDKPGIINVDEMKSLARNTPFAGKEISSEIYMTMIKGEVKYAKN